jgi:dTDP-6-deoxy-L-talose 4-dehydrogenase (NAD+)
MKILVTGSTGFIGSHVVDYLVKNNYEVIATSSDQIKAKSFHWFDKVTYKEFNLDLPVDEKINLHEYFDRPEIMLHLAWQGLPNYNKPFHIQKNLFTHYSFVKNLIENGLRNISITGTCLEYGLVNGCLNEEAQIFPSNYYAIAKDSLRRFIELLSESFEIKFNWIRLFYMYGDGQSQYSIISQLKEAVNKKQAKFKMSGGEQLRDYLAVELVAEYLAKITVQEKFKGIVNCCSGKPISVRKFIEDYIKLNDLKIELELGYYPYPTYEPFAFWGDNTKLKRILDYEL